MRFSRVHKVAAYLLAVLGLVVLGTGGELEGPFAFLLAIGVFLSWFAEGTILRDVRYTRSWTAAVLLSLVVELARTFLGFVAPLSAMIEFVCVLQLSRLANRRSAQEYQQSAVLAMVHLIAATVLGGGLSYAACFLGFVIVTPWAMTLGHLRKEIEGNYLADARTGKQNVPIDVARILRSRRVVGPGLLLGSSLLAVPIFLMTSILFVAFPRLGIGLFSVRNGRGQNVTGLGDRVELSGHGTLRTDPTVVLRIEPPDLGPNPPAQRVFRLRGASFDRYTGTGWSRSPSRPMMVEREASMYRLRTWPDRRMQGYRIVLDAIDPPVLLFPAGTSALQVVPRIEAALPRYPELTRDAGDEVRYVPTDDLGVVYTAFVPPNASERGDGMVLTGEQWERYITLPPMASRIATLAHQLTDREPTHWGKARAVERYLQSLRYTVELESGAAEHPVEDFLFRTRAGHCEYFSTAMVVLLRSVAVPSRNVTGFLGGTYNRYGNFYAIRQGDAHSWVEVYVPERGWVTFDPTPPAREPAASRSRPVAELDAILEALRVRWRRYIVGFDLSTQARMASRLSRMLRGSREQDHTAPTATSRWDQATRTARNPWFRATIFFAGVALAASLLLQRWKARVSPAKRSAAPRVRDALELARWLDEMLIARGIPRPRHRTPVGYAEDLTAAGSPLAPLVRSVAERYAEVRYGGSDFAPGELDQLRKQLRSAPELPFASKANS